LDDTRFLTARLDTSGDEPIIYCPVAPGLSDPVLAADHLQLALSGHRKGHPYVTWDSSADRWVPCLAGRRHEGERDRPSLPAKLDWLWRRLTSRYGVKPG
jgi:hypothetical protein